jgi:hypothetical protein
MEMQKIFSNRIAKNAQDISFNLILTQFAIFVWSCDFLQPIIPLQHVQCMVKEVAYYDIVYIHPI